MKNISKYILSLTCMAALSPAMAANTVETIDQVTTAVTVSGDVDYHVTASVPFATTGSIDITGTEHSVIIFDNVKPSKLLNYLSFITINGEKAVNNQTCQVKIHNRGSILMPYGSNIKPLTVYSGQNFTGEAVNDFGLESAGGFMNTLTDAKLNNKIRSFKLKRGYMVTFSTRAGGYGYNRCFIADTEDLEMAEMPAILDRSITSYRVFKWNDTGKKGLANDTRSQTNNALNTTWCYAFGLGEDTGIDRECVAHHIYEGWPALADCGRNNYTTSAPTMKTNNEPGNSADDHPQSVATVLAEWEHHMATGMRLCSPSSHDGSLSWLKEFMDSVDARGWRCDVVDVHSYWPEGSFYNLTSWYNQYRRPLWISEWCWGASWNHNGVFNSSLSDSEAARQNADRVKELSELMDGYDFVERYAFWNSEADRSKVYLNGALTAAGEYYAALESAVGYNKKYDYVPKIPKSKGAPSDLACKFDGSTGVSVLTWHEPNGEYNKSMTLERRKKGMAWQSIMEIDLQEDAADYTAVDNESFDGAEYRIHVIYADNKDYYTAKTATAVPGKVNPGDAMTVGETTMYIGGNLLANGDFDFDMACWTNGEGTALCAPHFKVFRNGGYDGGTYLQAFSNEAMDKVGSVKTSLKVSPYTNYYLSASTFFDGISYNRLYMSRDGVASDSTAVSIPNNTVWTKYGSVFNSGTYDKAFLSFRNLGSKAQFDQMGVYPLFATQEEAIADGIKAETRRAEMFMAHNTSLAHLNTNIRQIMEGADSSAEYLTLLSSSIDEAIEELYAFISHDPLTEQVDGLTELPFILHPSFDTQTSDWKKCGTYTEGTQGVAEVDGRKCWKATWNDVDASAGKELSMGIAQELTKNSSSDYLSHGLYALQCKAATDHYCLSDQHAYIVHNGDSIVSSLLSTDRVDIPTFTSEEKWQTLVTPVIYVDERETLTIGFTASKDGASDYAWKPYAEIDGKGDLREGWWCATDFTLLYKPEYHFKANASGWSTICLPYKATPSEGVTFYQIAGILPDMSAICLEEIAECEAGVPCVVYSDHKDVVIYESGEKTTKRTAGPNGLNGLFVTSSVLPQNSIALVNGRWVIQDSSDRNERVQMSNFSAYIKKMDDIQMVENWSGVTLPLCTLTNIGTSVIDEDDDAKYYSVSGIRTSDSHSSGVVIKKTKGKTRKIVKSNNR